VESALISSNLHGLPKGRVSDGFGDELAGFHHVDVLVALADVVVVGDAVDGLVEVERVDRRQAPLRLLR